VLWNNSGAYKGDGKDAGETNNPVMTSGIRF
jgi:hypothetical protein